MEPQICYSCFSTKSSAAGACPRCGYDAAADVGKYPHALPLGSILNGRYILGRVLGQGGFGITYVAQDDQTGGLVAIKEFFPEMVAARVQHHTVCAHSVQQQENFTYGMQCFLNEAQTLAQFIGVENIVRVHSYFEENGTAYFVMDYVDGISFQTYLRQKGGKISWEEARSILLPVMDALSIVHRKGIIHRDISPDNIYISRDGTVKLLDFGAARYSLGNRSRSLDVVLKAGYAPMEQYARRGRQGPYTDVYSMAATFYFAITGHLPPDSVERADEDNLVLPSSYGVKLPLAIEDAIEKGLSFRAADRHQTMEEFRSALLNVSAGSPSPAFDPVVPTVEIPVPPVQPKASQKPPVQAVPQEVPLHPVQPATPQPSPQPPKKKEKQPLSVILKIFLGIVLVFATILLQFPSTEEDQADEPQETVAETAPTQPEKPTNGWYEEDGNTYYMRSGKKVTGFQKVQDDTYYFSQDGVLQTTTPLDTDDWFEVGGKTYYINSAGNPARGLTTIGAKKYYFDRSGVLQKNKTVDDFLGSNKKYKTDSKGIVTSYYKDTVSGSWQDTDEQYNGEELNVRKMGITDCTAATFYIKAEGKNGSSINGQWVIVFKINGSWREIKQFSYTAPDNSVTLTFDTPIDIDAISAYPLNAYGSFSWTEYFELRDVWSKTEN